MPYCAMIRALPAVVMLMRLKWQRAVMAINKPTISQAVRFAAKVLGLRASGLIGWLVMGAVGSRFADCWGRKETVQALEARSGPGSFGLLCRRPTAFCRPSHTTRPTC